MGRDLFAKTVRDLRTSTIGWSLGLGLLAALTAAVYPSVRDNEALQAYYDSLPEAARTLTGGGDFTTVAGFFQTEIFSYLPLVLAVFTVGKAAALTLGEEEEGTMDLVLAQPVERWRLFLARAAGLGASLVLVLAFVGAVLAAVGAAIGLTGREIAGLAAWCLLAALPATVYGSAALAAAGFSHRRRTAILAGTFVAVGSFLLNGLAPLADWLSGFQDVSPHHWYIVNDPVSASFSLWGLARLVPGTLALVLVGVVGFQRKNIGV